MEMEPEFMTAAPLAIPDKVVALPVRVLLVTVIVPELAIPAPDWLAMFVLSVLFERVAVPVL